MDADRLSKRKGGLGLEWPGVQIRYLFISLLSAILALGFFVIHI